MDEQFRYGLVVKNSSVQHFVVMVVRRLPDWHYITGPTPSSPGVPEAMAVVLADGGRVQTHRVGQVIKISGKVGTEYGDWWVVE